MAKRSNEIITANLNVVWANLRRPDEFRGSKKHDISVVLSDELKSQLSELGYTTYTGSYVGKESGDTIVKVKTTDAIQKRNLESYDKIFDSQGQATDYFPQGGDVVRLKIWVRDFEGKASLFLNGVQVIEANGDTGAGGFEAVEGGFTSSKGECDNCPEAGCDACPKTDDATEDNSDVPF